ncbi:hypothetical protein LPJ74_005301 [Coemansia sp. RSA 1843]|nr:hypothetical protein LPJ74_005301 [Coemansia sp. RSA 1843]
MSKITAEFKHSKTPNAAFVLESDAVNDTKGLLGALEKMQKDLNAKLTTMMDVERLTRSPPPATGEANQPKRQNGSQKSTWVNPFTEALHRSVEPNCRVCDCSMDSWDMYFDHLMFDQDHQVNEMRELAERCSRTKVSISSHSPLPRRPEDPNELIQQAVAILNSKDWEFHTAYSIGGALCGIMALFLISVSIWRPVLVNRVSLRLIFAIIVYDFIVCVIQATAVSHSASANCRAGMFFSALFGYASVYTSTSIAVNLYITLLCGTRQAYLPRYTEYLYYAVPLLVALCQWAPPTIWAAVHGYCSAFEPIQTGTTAYVLYVVFLQLLLPLCALLFNICVSIRVIYVLVREQRSVSKSLREIMQQTHDRLFASAGELDSLQSTNGRKQSIMSEPMRKRLELNLLVMQKFNSAAIRIALYPFAPVAWWIINTVYYGLQYNITMTYKEDINRWVRMASLAWFSMPAIAIANFAVFVTDPAFVKVVKEVYGQLASMFRHHTHKWTRGWGMRRELEACILTNMTASAKDGSNSLSKRHFSDTTLAFDDSNMFSTNDNETIFGETVLPAKLKQGDILPPFSSSISSSTDKDLATIESSIEAASDSKHVPSLFDTALVDDDGGYRGNQMSQSTAVVSTYGEMIRRHLMTGNGENANRFYSKM